ncbi:phage antirepressor KilAC domain-containing protein [Paenibacillus polymyxa]|jgi:Rha family phage regulatory protein|uniref:phage antirepressor KilAC domain-containing protein n=1 Tax=Paenibacillus polymyxa TaxID=1406 RepID=UPI00083E313A|nr:DNA-binding protein [Paenibacillus polymyxa]ODB61385.1 antirepressor [Paenibacillus polymyxa]
MTQLQVINKDGTLLVDSREVALMTGKRHDHLIRDIDSYVAILNKSTSPNLGASNFFIETNYRDNKGELRRRYDITRKGCDMVANKMTGEKGVLFTAAYVTKFEEMERQASSPMVPQTLPEALRLAADLAEKNQLLLLQTEMDKPKVLFADAVTASKTSILVGELAKLLKQNGADMGQNRLFVWMRENGFLISRKGTDYNMPTQRSMELGLFEIKETSVTHSDGHITVSKTPKVTGKGQVYFINKFKTA